MKMLITEPCLVNFGDDRGGIHQDAGDLPDVPKDQAIALANVGRALYTDRKDDPDKSGRNTATSEMLKAAQELAKAKAKPVKE